MAGLNLPTGNWKPVESRGTIPPMKKPRVVIRTVTGHRIFIEHDGERVLYAVTSKLEKAKSLVQAAKRELGIAKKPATAKTP
jgi:hypothetical protein